jgi:hypothetical protein
MLKYLPYTIGKLKELQALWIAENQTKPLIPLQQEKDKSTGKKSLTCYLFPQEHINRYRGKSQYLNTNEHYLRDKRTEILKLNQQAAPELTHQSHCLNNDRNLKNIIDKTSLIMLHTSKDAEQYLTEELFNSDPNSKSQSIRFVTNDMPTLNSHGMFFRPQPQPPSTSSSSSTSSVNNKQDTSYDITSHSSGYFSHNSLLNQSPINFSNLDTAEKGFKVYQPMNTNFNN